MKTSRFKKNYSDNASKLHKRVGDILKSSNLFAHHKIYQEYPVNRINPSYSSGAHKFDWVVIDLFLVIECHGEQHYKPVCFGGISFDQAVENFNKQANRDNIKMDAAVDAGYTYLTVPYFDLDIVDADYIWQLYIEQQNPKQVVQFTDTFNERCKEQQSKYRKEQYLRQKEWRRSKNKKIKVV